jgi:hypothetical protein
MGGKRHGQPLFLAVLTITATVPPNDPLCSIKHQMDAVHQKLSRLFEELSELAGRPGIPATPLLQMAEAA